MTYARSIVLPPRTWPSEDLPVRQPALPLLFTDTGQEPASGPTCSAAGSLPAQNGLSWSSPPETRRGKPKSLTTFAELAATSPSLSSALMTLVRSIHAGAVTWLPAPACRDWRSPGLRSHKRLSEPRGQQLPEVIGTRIPSPLSEWMLGVPKGFTNAGSASKP